MILLGFWPSLSCFGSDTGAGKRNRTPDLMITNQLLYHLSYAGFLNEAKYTAPLSTTQPENRPLNIRISQGGQAQVGGARTHPARMLARGVDAAAVMVYPLCFAQP